VSTVEHQLWQAASDGSSLLAQLQAAGVPARQVLLISSEPLDPAALPLGSRYRVLAGGAGAGAGGPGSPVTLSAGVLAAVVVTCVLLGLLLAVGVALLVQRRHALGAAGFRASHGARGWRPVRPCCAARLLVQAGGLACHCGKLPLRECICPPGCCVGGVLEHSRDPPLSGSPLPRLGAQAAAPARPPAAERLRRARGRPYSRQGRRRRSGRRASGRARAGAGAHAVHDQQHRTAAGQGRRGRPLCERRPGRRQRAQPECAPRRGPHTQARAATVACVPCTAQGRCSGPCIWRGQPTPDAGAPACERSAGARSAGSPSMCTQPAGGRVAARASAGSRPGRAPVRAGSSAHAAHAASAFSVHCTPRKALHASLAQQAAERRAGGLRPAAPSAGSAEGDRRAAEAEAGAAGADGASPGEWADAGADGAPRAGPRLAPVERGGSGASTSGRTGSGAIELPVLPWSDWEIPADEIRICRRPNGAEWELGSGAFGKARRSRPGGEGRPGWRLFGSAAGVHVLPLLSCAPHGPRPHLTMHAALQATWSRHVQRARSAAACAPAGG